MANYYNVTGSKTLQAPKHNMKYSRKREDDSWFFNIKWNLDANNGFLKLLLWRHPSLLCSSLGEMFRCNFQSKKIYILHSKKE